MRRLTASLLIALAFAGGCDEKPKDGEAAKAEAPTWTASVAELESTGELSVGVKTPNEKSFKPWRGGQPIPAGSTVETAENVRATLSLPDDGSLTLNHSTRVTLAEKTKLSLTAGQAVLAYPSGHGDVTVELPTGEVVLHGTKVALIAAEDESTVTVTQGLVEVRHENESFEGRAGQEIVLPKEGKPRVTESADLGQRIGWSEIGEVGGSEALPEVPRGLGKLVGKTPGQEAEHRLDLREHKVNVTVRGNLAYTEIHETFENPTGQTLEGVYRFPLPADARINRLALKVGSKWMEGEFLETARAERIWRDVINQWRDPAMLKWKEGNTFELRIFPIDPRTKREVKIGYVQRLEPSVGGYRYTYPMPVDREGLIPADRFEFQAELLEHDPTLPLEVTGYPAQVENSATKDDRAVTRVKWSKDDFLASGDLGIRFGMRESGGLRTYTYRDREKEDPYAVFVVRPDLPRAAEYKPRDFVLVVDRSTSRRGAALEVQRRLVPRMIREMDPLDRVTVVACSHRCEPVGEPSFQTPRASSADDVAAALTEVDAAGASYPVEAVRVAAELFRRRSEKDREAHVVYLTDGVASAGELRPGKAGDAVRRTLSPFNARMTVVDIGGDTDDLMLDALATAGRGRVHTLDPMLSMTGQALAILSDHYRTVLENPSLEAPSGVRLEANLPTAIAAGEELVFAARFDEGTSGTLKLRGQMAGKPVELDYPVTLNSSKSAGNTFVPGEWAATRIESLELSPDDHQKEIIRLSKRYGVLSRYTTLLALESKEMMDEFNVRSRDRTQWDGEAAADDSDGEEFQEAGPSSAAERAPSPRPAAEPTRSTRAAKPRPKPAQKKKSMPMLDSLGGDSAFSTGPSGGGFAPRRRHRIVMIDEATINSPESTTAWERSNVDRKRSSLANDPDNRTRRMRLIRAMIRANQLPAAKQQIDDWYQTNPMDPEAIVQRAQLQARLGQIGEFYATLLDAADAAPRGKWLLERLENAARAQDDEALACAFDVSVEGTLKRAPKESSDILTCPMTTLVGTWFGGSGPGTVKPPAEKAPRGGQLRVELKSSGGDWDLALVEPSGRLLWWGSARQRLEFANIRGNSGPEFLTLPRLRNGTYSVIAIPRTGKVGDVLTVEISTRVGKNRTQTFTRTVSGVAPLEIAEIVRERRRVRR